MAELVDLRDKLFDRQHRRGERTEATYLGDGDCQRDTAGAGHRCLHDRQLDSEPGPQVTLDGHTQTLRGTPLADPPFLDQVPIGPGTFTLNWVSEPAAAPSLCFTPIDSTPL